jgi:hypothetical protein
MVAATLVGIFLIPALFAGFQRLRERLKGQRATNGEGRDS